MSKVERHAAQIFCGDLAHVTDYVSCWGMKVLKEGWSRQIS